MCRMKAPVSPVLWGPPQHPTREGLSLKGPVLPLERQRTLSAVQVYKLQQSRALQVFLPKCPSRALCRARTLIHAHRKARLTESSLPARHSCSDAAAGAAGTKTDPCDRCTLGKALRALRATASALQCAVPQLVAGLPSNPAAQAHFLLCPERLAQPPLHWRLISATTTALLANARQVHRIGSNPRHKGTVPAARTPAATSHIMLFLPPLSPHA